MVPYPPAPHVPDVLDEDCIVQLTKMYYEHCMSIDKLNANTYDMWLTQVSISKINV